MTSGTPRKRRGDRYDASRVKLSYDLNAMFPYLMKGRNDSIAYFPISVNAEPLLAYIEKNKGTDNEITIFQAFMLALVKTLRARPTLNRYIIGRRLYQRHNVVLSFIARQKYSDDSQETNVLVTIKPEDDRATAIAKLTGEIRVAKKGEQKDDDKLVGMFLHLPRGLLRFAIKLLEWWDFYVDTPGFLKGIDPLRASVYVANLGSVGLGAPYHHLFEWGTCSLFVSIGKIEPTVCVGDDGQPTVRKMAQLRVALDERIADGYYDARSLELMMDYLEHPEMLETL
ncbi:MAG: 2-oxo acid dehydrogenase subunit E2 [Propionibacteriaceae bacterium]|nr:2-oxo acid dehydrogenase subunit E2 [Propionibacteriaceae bacterium]